MDLEKPPEQVSEETLRKVGRQHHDLEKVLPSDSASGGPQELADQPGIVPGSQFSVASPCFVLIPSGISF